MVFSIEPLGEHIAGEVKGIDLRAPVDAETLAALNDALAEHVVLVFRDQDLNPVQFVEAAGIFGPTMRQHYSQFESPDHPHLAYVSSEDGGVGPDGKRVPRATMWHTDHTNHERPPKATMLYAVELPSQGGGTSFANMRAGLAALPENLQSRLAGMKTVNNLAVEVTKGGNARARPEDAEKFSNNIVHPMVRTHPDNGTKALYFHISKTERIEGMEPEESIDFLADLLAQAIRPEFVYRHDWRLGDMVVFDNRASMHRAHADYDMSERRLLYRVIVEGDRPV